MIKKALTAITSRVGEHVIDRLLKKETFTRPTVVVLIAANLYPLYGVAFLEWDFLGLILLYWIETLIIILFTLVKMLIVVLHLKRQKKDPSLAPLSTALLYFVAYGTVSFIIIALFVPDMPFDAPFLPNEHFLPTTALTRSFGDIIIGMYLFFISHLFSFSYNFLYKKEFSHVPLGALTMLPYRRFVLIILLILITFALLNPLSPFITLISLILLKILIDINAHVRAHTPL